MVYIASEWDEEKARLNILKHGVSFEEAQSVLNDRLVIILAGEREANAEERWFAIEMNKANKLLAVWYTERGESVRIIGARKATKAERRIYENEQLS
jgi:uncharacterized DUF497 family protein